jgi:hypothetical protein
MTPGEVGERGSGDRMIFKFLNRLTGVFNTTASLLYQQVAGQSKYADPRRLAGHELRVHSQNGEDGIVQHLLQQVDGVPTTFVEIGVGDGRENNTVFLLKQGWRGLWIEGSPAFCKKIRKSFAKEIATGQLILIEAFIEPDNVDSLVKSVFTGEIGILSIDIDRDTHHVWSRLQCVNPVVAIIEYNASFRPPLKWSCEYVPGKMWDGGVDYGASLQVIEDIGKSKGYSLVGCDLCGVNAFLVRQDLASEKKFFSPFDAVTHYEPARHAMQPPGKYRL